MTYPILESLQQVAQGETLVAERPLIVVAGSVGKSTTARLIGCVLGGLDHDVQELDAGDGQGPDGLGTPQLMVVTHLAEPGACDEAATRPTVELLESLPSDAWAVLDGDDARLRKLAAGCSARILWIGRGMDCDWLATQVQSADGELSFRVHGRRFRLPAWGRHYLPAALAAVAVGQVLGLSDERIAQGLAGFSPPVGCCEVIRLADVTWIQAGGRTTSASARAALAVLREFPTDGRRVVLCGEMEGTGETASSWRRQMGEEVVTRCGADLLVDCGVPAFDVLEGAWAAGLPHSRGVACPTTQRALAHLNRVLAADDVVLAIGTTLCVGSVERVRVCGNSNTTLPPG